jgi:hypothetical protein
MDVERSRRSVEETEDSVVADVRRAFRTLEQARRSYDIEKEGVRIAERRAESAKISLEAGRPRTTISDVLDAESALVGARNGLTSALVAHAVARLELERDTGTLNASILARPRVPGAPESLCASSTPSSSSATVTSPGSGAQTAASATDSSGLPPAAPAVPAPSEAPAAPAGRDASSPPK